MIFRYYLYIRNLPYLLSHQNITGFVQDRIIYYKLCFGFEYQF